MKNVLVACEFSGVVRDAFDRLGHNAWSCDLLPSESELTNQGGKHIVGNVLDVIGEGCWDLMIAHPPCTYLCSSGIHWNKRGSDYQKAQRVAKTYDALEFVRSLMGANIHQIAIENPVGIISTQIRKPDQYIQPYQFGHAESKRTCLWLKNLPCLVPTKNMEAFKEYPCWIPNKAEIGTFYCTVHKMLVHDCPCPPAEEWQCDPYTGGKFVWSNQTPSGQNNLGPSRDRGKKRSITYPGIAEAMADQWGKI